MSHDSLKSRAGRAGSVAFGSGWRVDSWAVAPGRIELIGNHIDYNGGPVLAGAIDRVVVVGSGNIDATRHISMVSADVNRQRHTFDALKLGDWRAGEGDSGPVVYLKGVVAALAIREIPFRTGVGVVISGDVPRGFGMSSSAALCVATILALTVDEIDPLDMVAIAREAEHRAGAPVGAMDQSTSVAGEVIRFDGRDNSYSRISPSLGDLVFAVASSGVGRSLRTSSYATRVRETEAARQVLAEAYGLDLPGLSALAPHWDDVMPTIDHHLDETLLKRVRHVVSETQRVAEAETAMRLGDWDRFGELMNASGESSARDYEISHPRVEALVHLLREQDGVLGARMMGGGEGGPALALLHRDAVSPVSNTLKGEFYNSRKMAAEYAVLQRCVFGPGAHREDA
jgi:galactokinase